MRLLLVGCGKMGAALLRQALAARLITAAVVIEPAGQGGSALDPDAPVAWYQSADLIDATFQPDLIVMAVKPQQMATVLPTYARFSASLFVSIAAGLTLNGLQSMLGDQHTHALIRVMPNLPASIGAGMSVAVANPQVSPTQKDMADQFLRAVGAVAWLANEDLMDAVTALSGSGPAYVFALGEVMARVGESLGLPPDMAAVLARQTLVGSGALVAQTPDDLDVLRRAVTSPGGTTEAALKHLLADDGFPDLLRRAMVAARDRAQELAH